MITKRKSYSDADLADVSDSPEWTESTFAEAKPFAEMFPQVAKKLRGRPKSERPKVQVTLRIDADIVDRYRSEGRGWQSRMNETLRRASSTGRFVETTRKPVTAKKKA